MISNICTTQGIREAIALSGIAPPSEIILDGDYHRFGPNDRYWFRFQNMPVPLGIWGDELLGVAFTYAHTEPPVVLSEKALIKASLSEFILDVQKKGLANRVDTMKSQEN